MIGATLRLYQTRASLALLFLILSTACSNSLFKVKPPNQLPAMPASAATANAGPVSLRAAPFLTDEETQALFESNLQLAGLLPVRMEMVNGGSNAIEMKKLRFRLRDASGADWKLISSRNAISRILKANDITLYNPNARKNFEQDFRAYEFDLNTPLPQSARRQGLIIFLSPKKEPVASPHGLVLTVEVLAQPVSLSLN